MKTNLKLDLKFSPQAILTVLAKAERTIVGIGLIGLFGYTAFVVQSATNAKADPVTSAATISFDQKTIDSLKTLTVVNGDTPVGSLGKSDPFGQ